MTEVHTPPRGDSLGRGPPGSGPQTRAGVREDEGDMCGGSLTVSSLSVLRSKLPACLLSRFYYYPTPEITSSRRPSGAGDGRALLAPNLRCAGAGKGLRLCAPTSCWYCRWGVRPAVHLSGDHIPPEGPKCIWLCPQGGRTPRQYPQASVLHPSPVPSSRAGGERLPIQPWNFGICVMWGISQGLRAQPPCPSLRVSHQLPGVRCSP